MGGGPGGEVGGVEWDEGDEGDEVNCGLVMFNGECTYKAVTGMNRVMGQWVGGEGQWKGGWC